MLKLSKKIALPLIAVLLIGTGIGGYFLFRNFQIPKYFVDRYPELIEYCDTQESENGLKVSCKALMLDIKPNVSDGTPSLTSLVITNDEELKEYTITEKEEVFAWTNEVLHFKKLKPVIINIQYTKGNLLKYSLSSITFEEIPDTYIQEIVNRDMEEIMGMDKSSTTILNSLDFCPRPETLPDYVAKKEEYTAYWNENILSKDDYQNEELYTTDDTEIKLLFGCDSQRNLEYLNDCSINNLNLTSNFRNVLNTSEPQTPQWGIESEGINQVNLKQISLTYDETNLLLTDYMPLLKNGEGFVMIENNLDVLKSLIDTINSETNVTEEVFCGTVKLLENFENIPEVRDYITKVSRLFLDNIPLSSSAICANTLGSDVLDKTGLYIKYLLTESHKNMALFNRCINLQEFIK